MTAWVDVEADHYQFFLAAVDVDPSRVPSEGDVIDVSTNVIAVHTGIANGPVAVAISRRGSHPGEPNGDDWENIDQASVQVTKELVVIDTLGDVNDELDPVIPPSSGWLAVRVSVSGRAEHRDEVVEEPTERFLIEVWPADGPAQLQSLRSTDGVRAVEPGGRAASSPGEGDGEPDFGDVGGDATARLRGPVVWDPEQQG